MILKFGHGKPCPDKILKQPNILLNLNKNVKKCKITK